MCFVVPINMWKSGAPHPDAKSFPVRWYKMLKGRDKTFVLDAVGMRIRCIFRAVGCAEVFVDYFIVLELKTLHSSAMLIRLL